MVKYGTGYFQEHATNPQTIGYSLADSPVGLLGWIYEKLHHWTDEYEWDDDESEFCYKTECDDTNISLSFGLDHFILVFQGWPRS